MLGSRVASLSALATCALCVGGSILAGGAWYQDDACDAGWRCTAGDIALGLYFVSLGVGALMLVWVVVAFVSDPQPRLADSRSYLIEAARGVAVALGLMALPLLSMAF